MLPLNVKKKYLFTKMRQNSTTLLKMTGSEQTACTQPVGEGLA